MALTTEEKEWAQNVIRDHVSQSDEYCSDNYRIAEEGDPEEEANYELLRSSGCCGFYDNLVKHPITGKTIKIGYNYGH